MLEKFFQAFKDLVFVLELSKRNADDVRELRRRTDDLSLLVERLAFEIQRIRENEAHEREKLLLKLENKSLGPKNKPRKK